MFTVVLLWLVISLGICDEKILLSDKTLTKADSPYVMTESVRVKSGVSLVVEPGVQIFVDCSSKCSLFVDGSLEMRGKKDDEILVSRKGPGAGEIVLNLGSPDAFSHVFEYVIFDGGLNVERSFNESLESTALLRVVDSNEEESSTFDEEKPDPPTLKVSHVTFRSAETAIDVQAPISLHLEECTFHQVVDYPLTYLSKTKGGIYARQTILLEKTKFTKSGTISICPSNDWKKKEDCEPNVIVQSSSFSGNSPSRKLLMDEGSHKAIFLVHRANRLEIGDSEFSNNRGLLLYLFIGNFLLHRNRFECNRNVRLEFLISLGQGFFVGGVCGNNKVTENVFEGNTGTFKFAPAEIKNNVFSRNEVLDEKLIEINQGTDFSDNVIVGNQILSKTDYVILPSGDEDRSPPITPVYSVLYLAPFHGVWAQNALFLPPENIRAGCGTRTDCEAMKKIRGRNNVFVGNEEGFDYDIESGIDLGESDSPLDFSENYFGEGVTAKDIQKRIYDFKKKGTLEQVVFEPFLTTEPKKKEGLLPLSGNSCEEYKCFGVKEFSKDVCSGYGKCVFGKCYCEGRKEDKEGCNEDCSGCHGIQAQHYSEYFDLVSWYVEDPEDLDLDLHEPVVA